MDQPTTDAQQASQPIDESILKTKPERKRPNFTPEHRAALAERMKKVNADRIANSKTHVNARLVEERKAVREAKKKELDAEIERLKQQALADGPRLESVKKTPRKPREVKLPFDEKEYDDLIAKVKSMNEMREKAKKQVIEESESEDDPEPPKRVKKPTQAKTAPAPAPAPQPVLRCKFV